MEVAVGEGGCCISSTVVRYWNVAAKVMDGGGGGDTRHFRMTSVNHTNTLFFLYRPVKHREELLTIQDRSKNAE